ncbi:hypothetical protein CGRA01v4_08875 [Colletotrichum graminicola]|nr:hypothetical protein CGRA01v4_08875 [Colletotrichum graminicola]
MRVVKTWLMTLTLQGFPCSSTH